MNQNERQIVMNSPYSAEQAREVFRAVGSSPATVKRLTELACQGYTPEDAIKALKRR